MNEETCRGILGSVKDSLLNLLVFLLVFIAVAGIFLGTYTVALTLVPGGKGLIFANPYAAALLPGLFAGLVAAQYRTVHRPGKFALSWSLLAGAFFLLLTLSIPLIQQMPPVRASDDTPLVSGRFLPLEDGSQWLTPASRIGVSGPVVKIPANHTPMSVSAETQFDPLNQRFVFSEGEPLGLGSTGPERRYFQYTPAMKSLQQDLLALYTTLRQSSEARPLVFWFQAAVVTWLFLGLFFFFSWKTWPIVHVVLVLLLVRLGLVLTVYAFWSLPAVIDVWLPGADGLKTWGPLFLIATVASTLFFMTWLSKPHHRSALT